MAATYDTSLPTDKDWVRFMIGDRDVAAATLQDEEINAILGMKANKYLAAADCAQMMLALNQGLIEKQVETLKLQWSNKGAESTYQIYIEYLRKMGTMMMSPAPAVFKVL